MVKKLVCFLGISLIASPSLAEVVKFEGKMPTGQDCVVRLLGDIQTRSGIKKLVQVESMNGEFVNQSSLMADMSFKGEHFRAIETVQRGSSVYNNLHISEDGKTMSYTSHLLTKSSRSELIFACESVK